MCDGPARICGRIRSARLSSLQPPCDRSFAAPRPSKRIRLMYTIVRSPSTLGRDGEIRCARYTEVSHQILKAGIRKNRRIAASPIAVVLPHQVLINLVLLEGFDLFASCLDGDFADIIYPLKAQ